MFLYNQAMIEAQSKLNEMIEAAEKHRLASIVQNDSPRFQLLSRLLTVFQRQRFTLPPTSVRTREVKRKTASNQGW